MYSLLGVAGSSIAVAFGQLTGLDTIASPAGLVLSVLGATLLLFSHVVILKKRATAIEADSEAPQITREHRLVHPKKGSQRED